MSGGPALPRLLPRDGEYSVCRLPPGCPVEVPAGADFFSLTRSTSETSVVCRAGDAPGGAEVEAGWRLLEVEGPLAFSQIGVLAGLAEPLAEAGVSIFVVSTFDTDYLMVREESWAAARVALTAAGYELATPDPPSG